MRAADLVDQRLKVCGNCQERIRGQLTKLEDALPAAARWTGEVRLLLIELNQQVQLIKVDMAVDIMTGEADGRTAQGAVEELELFACAQPARIYHDRKMDAAGDHTTDAVDGEERL